MGWPWGAEIFDAVASTFVEHDTRADLVEETCTKLLRALLDRGWDGAAGAVQEYRDVEPVVNAFAACGVYLPDDRRNPDYGDLRNEHAEMYPEGCGQDGCRFCEGHDDGPTDGADRTPGQVAYEAYLASSDGRSLITGDALPRWDEQDARIKEAWQAAALATARHTVTLALKDLTAGRDATWFLG